ncbi:glycosyltransferase [Roseococcus pinisoli]|uniref:Glycosyltransferase n=1 Tax=Roseococcus pinisoli TaxID=2835040 RepID=A0ABS5QKA3_9PROT|nr:glycosyltransferase [Roseococcus pinisoli]
MELALAEVLLASGGDVRFVFTDGGRLRQFDSVAAKALLKEAARRWRGDARDTAVRRVLAYLSGSEVFPPMCATWRDGRLGVGELAEWGLAMLRFGRWRALRLSPEARAAATYVNVSHRNLDDGRLYPALRGFGRRIAYLHDDIPLRAPELSLPSLTRAFGKMFRYVAAERFEVLTNSRFSADCLCATAVGMGLGPMRPRVILPPLSSPFLSPPPALATARRFFVTTGLFTRRKNAAVLGAAASIAARLPCVTPFDIVFVGAPGRDAASSLAALPGAAEKVRLLRAEGLSDQAYWRLLGASSGLLAPSLDEGYDYPVQEALVAGVRVLASDIPAHREFVPARENLLPCDDPEAWAKAMVKAARDAPGILPGRRRSSEYRTAARSSITELAGYVTSPLPPEADWNTVSLGEPR